MAQEFFKNIFVIEINNLKGKLETANKSRKLKYCIELVQSWQENTRSTSIDHVKINFVHIQYSM